MGMVEWDSHVLWTCGQMLIQWRIKCGEKCYYGAPIQSMEHILTDFFFKTELDKIKRPKYDSKKQIVKFNYKT